MSTTPIPTKHRKKWATIGLSCFAIVWLYSLISYTPYLNNFPFFNNLQIGLNTLQGYPTYINGRMWRINETNYLVWTKGQTVNIESDHFIGNYSTCYAVTIQFNLKTLFLSFNETVLNYIHNETSCRLD